MGSMFGNRIGAPGFWASNRIEQVHHLRNWAMIAIDTICCKIASIMPNMAAVVGHSRPGVTVKAGQRSLANLMGRGFNGDPFVGQHFEKQSSWSNPKASIVTGSYVGTDGYDPAAVGFSSGGHSFLTMGEWRSKALSVLKPHEELEPLEPDHPLRRLIENPNPVDTFFDIEYELQMFEELCGVSYEWTPKNAFGRPCERWCIPSHWVYPRTSGGQYVPFYQDHQGELVWDYEIRPWGYPGYAGVLHFPPDEVIVTRWKNPLSKIDGYSKLSAGAQWIDEEEGISQSRWSQMINQARPDMIVTLGPGYEDPSADEIARVEAKFLQRVQGAFNYSKPLIAPPGATVTPYSFNPTEMAYFQCLDTKTECLTKNGWVKYKDLTLDTEIACYDKDTGTLIYSKPSNIHVSRYTGKMCKWSGTRVSSLMTPNHRCYVERPTSRMVGGEYIEKVTPYRDSFRVQKCRVGATIINERVWDVKLAGELAQSATYSILAAAPAACDIPTPIKIGNKTGWRQRIDGAPHDIDPKVWLRFLGYYISEGCSNTRQVGNGVNGWEIDIAQKKYVDNFRQALNETPFDWKEYTNSQGVTHWRASDKALYWHLSHYCGKESFSKKIPDYVKSWPAEYLRVLLDALIEGDGSLPRQTEGRGGANKVAGWSSQYYTRSETLADDVMEIAVKCGLFASITKDLDKREEYKDVPLYTVNIGSRNELDVTPDMRSEVDYDDDVWCVTVPTGMFVVRREGKAHVTGNSEEQVRDMILSLWRIPGAAVGLVREMTYGSIMATLGALCVFCLNPRLAMRGQSRTKFLASQFDETAPAWSQSGVGGRDSGGASNTRHMKLWYDDCVPADPQQVNADIAEDRSHYAITPNEVRALRGRGPFKRGGDNPIMQGPGGAMPLAINAEENVDEMAAIMEQLAAAQKPEASEDAGGSAVVPEGDQLPETPTPEEQQDDAELQPPGIEAPNDGQTLGNKGWKPSPACEEALLDRGFNREQARKIADGVPASKPAVVAHLIRAGLDKQEAEAVAVETAQLVAKRHVRKQAPIAAGIAVRADDTGRVLMIQRPLEEGDPNSGKWEFPGGKIDEGESPLEAAIREWQEEVGVKFPMYGRHGGFREWQSGNGKYVGFVLTGLRSEDAIDLSDRHPDPDGSGGNAVVAWVDPRDLPNHNLRPALLGDIDEVLAAVKKYLVGKVVAKSVRKNKGTCGIGERADLTGCQPANGASSSKPQSSIAFDVPDDVKEAGKGVEAAAKKSSKVRASLAKTYAKVSEAIDRVSASKLPAKALQIADSWIFNQVIGQVAAAEGLPGAVTVAKVAAWGMAKAWVAMRGKVGKSAGEVDLKELQKVLAEIAKAAGLKPPTLAQLKKLASKEKK